jgi:membrane-bound lytic murein transglycosylase A
MTCNPVHPGLWPSLEGAPARGSLRTPRRDPLRSATVLALLLCPLVAGSQTNAQSADAVREIRTRHATFQVAEFTTLRGWPGDDLAPGLEALRVSCSVLNRRPAWREACQRLPSADSDAARRHLETWFRPVRVLNPDASASGMLTGYFEPLLAGRLQRGGEFQVPVLGVPTDLRTVDWSIVPAEQRGAPVYVKPEPTGRAMTMAHAGEPGAVRMDLRDFELDSKDRRLRVKVEGHGVNARAAPYPAREQIVQGGTAPAAPVLAWVADALALYSMQIQGSGRVRLDDGRVLRLQYAEQNGQPFRPLRIGARPKPELRTRSAGSGQGDLSTDEFELIEEPVAEGGPGLRTRGLRRTNQTAVNQTAVNQAVEDLLGNKRSTGAPAAEPAQGPAPVPVPRMAPTGRPEGSARETGGAVRPGSQVPAVTATGVPETASARVTPAHIVAAMNSDPSYVFFQVARDQSPTSGPIGALGVPLTAGGTVAVDPRVTPLGYPLFVITDEPLLRGQPLGRLVAAQDTGGAIRGAVRADFFWGFGAQAGQLARATRHVTQLWILMPLAEIEALARPGLRTRSVGPAAECLVADGEFCSEVGS